VKLALQGAGLVQRGRKRGCIAKRRPRRALPGMLLHIDGSRHRWFQDERWHDGTWHRISPKHLPAYLDEMTFSSIVEKNADLFLDYPAPYGDCTCAHVREINGVTTAIATKSAYDRSCSNPIASAPVFCFGYSTHFHKEHKHVLSRNWGRRKHQKNAPTTFCIS